MARRQHEYAQCERAGPTIVLISLAPLLPGTASINATIDAYSCRRITKYFQRVLAARRVLHIQKPASQRPELFAVCAARVIFSKVWDSGGMSD